MGDHRGLEDELVVVDQASHAAAESKVQVGFRCTQAWKVQVSFLFPRSLDLVLIICCPQLLALLHVRLLHGLRPGVQVQLGDRRGRKRRRGKRV